MKPSDAAELIRWATTERSGAWADVGAGDGMFTRALFELLGPSSRIYAVDRDRSALASIQRWAAQEGADVTTVVADFTRPFDLPGLDGDALDGMLFSNSLHFVRDQVAVLERLVSRVRPGGRVVIVEYDRRASSMWVPHPIPSSRLPALARAAGLTMPIVVGRRPSAYGGSLYAAASVRATAQVPKELGVVDGR